MRVLQNYLIEASQELRKVVIIIIYNLHISGKYSIERLSTLSRIIQSVTGEAQIQS